MPLWLNGHRDFDPSVDTVLKQRGFRRAKCCDLAHVLRPTTGGPVNYRWLELLSKLTARKLLRKVVQQRDTGTQALIDICAEPRLSEYLGAFRELGVLAEADTSISPVQDVNTFGHTLEWYTSTVMANEFLAATCWGVQIEDIYGGGDFDVLSWLDSISALVYVECKAKRPADVDDSEIKHFFQRCQELAPEIAVLFVDTDGSLQPLLHRMQEILLPLTRVASGIREEDWKPDKPFVRPVPGDAFSGIHFGQRRVFVTSSVPSIPTQLRKCLRYYSTWVQHQSFWGEPPIDYVKGEVLAS